MSYSSLELYIRIQDGRPFEHPLSADNFREAFPNVDTGNLDPTEFARFKRVPAPEIGTYDVYEGATYEWAGDFVTDVHHIRPMTDEEIVVKKEQLAQQANDKCQMRIVLLDLVLENEVAEDDIAAHELFAQSRAAHEAWVLESVDPITPPFPPFPFKDRDGNWALPPVQ